jgi:hypothetical protein
MLCPQTMQRSQRRLPRPSLHVGQIVVEGDPNPEFFTAIGSQEPD